MAEHYKQWNGEPKLLKKVNLEISLTSRITWRNSNGNSFAGQHQHNIGRIMENNFFQALVGSPMLENSFCYNSKTMSNHVDKSNAGFTLTVRCYQDNQRWLNIGNVIVN